MENQRKTVVFNTVWYEIIKECSAEVIGEVFKAVMEYALYAILPEGICNEANVIFQFIKLDIDRREKRRQWAHNARNNPKPKKSPKQKSDTSDNSDSSDSSATPNDIVSQYYSMYKAPEAASIDNKGKQREVSADRIRSLVQTAADNIVEKGLMTPRCPEFFIRLNQIVTARYKYVCDHLRDMDRHADLDEDAWNTIFNKSYWVAKP